MALTKFTQQPRMKTKNTKFGRYFIVYALLSVRLSIILTSFLTNSIFQMMKVTKCQSLDSSLKILYKEVDMVETVVATEEAVVSCI